jgi:hypothetical protein
VQIELCLENHTPQSSLDSAVKPEVSPALPLPAEMEGSAGGRKRNRSAPGPNARHSHPLHRTWANMIQRCTNPNNTHFEYYGGRGICICERWMDFLKFVEDVGPRPSELHTLDRKDNAGNYCRENIQWATRLEQGQNRRDNHVLEHNGLRLTISEWGRRLGVSYVCILHRIKRGWSVERTVTQPPRR